MQNVTTDSENLPNHRGRGRPRKLVVETDTAPPRRGRGRPRKFPLEAAAMPRRGRPPKSAAQDKDGQISMFSTMPAPAAKTASLEGAAMHCGVTGRTMKLYFSKYPELAARTVVARGAKGVDSWTIDLDALDKWRHETGFLVFQDGVMGEQGATRRINATERRADLQAQMLEMELARARDQVLDRTEVESKLRTAFAHVAKGLDDMPQKLGAVCDLPGDVVEKMMENMDILRRSLVMEIADLMPAPQQTPVN